MRKIPPGFQEIDPLKLRMSQIFDRFSTRIYSNAIFIYLVRLGVILEAQEEEFANV